MFQPVGFGTWSAAGQRANAVIRWYHRSADNRARAALIDSVRSWILLTMQPSFNLSLSDLRFRPSGFEETVSNHV